MNTKVNAKVAISQTAMEGVSRRRYASIVLKEAATRLASRQLKSYGDSIVKHNFSTLKRNVSAANWPFDWNEICVCA